MSEWKKEFAKEFIMYEAEERRHIAGFISTEVIEKLIEEIKTELQLTEQHSFIQELRANWLGKERNAH